MAVDRCRCLPSARQQNRRKDPFLPPALEVLAGRPHFAGNEHVIPGRAPHRHPGRGSASASAGLGDLRLHELRHGFASAGVAEGESLFIVGKLLGHRQSRTTERFDGCPGSGRGGWRGEIEAYQVLDADEPRRKARRHLGRPGEATQISVPCRVRRPSSQYEIVTLQPRIVNLPIRPFGGTRPLFVCSPIRRTSAPPAGAL